MKLSITEAKRRFAEIIRAVEGGDTVVITRRGKAVVQITAPPQSGGKARLGGMRDRIQFKPGWADSIDLDKFLAGDL